VGLCVVGSNAIIFKALRDTTFKKQIQGSKGFEPPNNPFVKILMINVIFQEIFNVAQVMIIHKNM
jgi:hypothetical protein